MVRIFLISIIFSLSGAIALAQSPFVPIDDLPGLEHVIAIIDGGGITNTNSDASREDHGQNYSVINGSLPHGDEGFASLKKLGVKTIICVDGAAPDVEQAKKFKMRYVHLPIGYDGIEKDEGLKLARAMRCCHQSA